MAANTLFFHEMGRPESSKATDKTTFCYAITDPFKFDALKFLLRDRVVACIRSDVLHVKVKVVVFVHVARRMPCRGV
jgi:hypothetical protein